MGARRAQWQAVASRTWRGRRANVQPACAESCTVNGVERAPKRLWLHHPLPALELCHQEACRLPRSRKAEEMLKPTLPSSKGGSRTRVSRAKTLDLLAGQLSARLDSESPIGLPRLPERVFQATRAAANCPSTRTVQPPRRNHQGWPKSHCEAPFSLIAPPVSKGPSPSENDNRGIRSRERFASGGAAGARRDVAIGARNRGRRLRDARRRRVCLRAG